MLTALLDAIEGLPLFGRLARELPAPHDRVRVSGLPGSSAAALTGALVRRMGQARVFVVVTESLADAERWLSDLDALLGAGSAALYPPREGFGEVEPHLEVAGERVETLERLARGEVRVLVTTARAVLERTRLPSAVRSARIELRAGEVHRLESLVAHLTAVGFEPTPLVEEVAQFAVRGGIVDIYSFGMAEPVRLEFFGDEIASMRHFDIATQLSTRDAERVVILPVDAPAVAEQFAEQYPEPHPEQYPEPYPGSVTSLLPPDSIFVLPGDAHLEPEMRRAWDEAQHHVDLARRREEDVPDRDALFRPPTETLTELAAFGTIAVVPAAAALPPQPAESRAPSAEPALLSFPLLAPELVERDIKRLRRLVDDGTPTLILCDNAGQAERLEELLTESAMRPSPAALAVGVLDGGFVIPAGGGHAGLRVLTDHEIFRRERRIRRARRYSSGGAAVNITALVPGDYVVHLEHGVGIFRGIERIFVGEATIEAAVIEYEGGDRLNVPLYRIDQIERYRAAADTSDDVPPPRLHKLGGKTWSRQRDRTRAALQEMTEELLDLYARRRVATKTPALPDGSWQRQLESSFLFEDTPDQRRATVDVKRDMESTRPMDRLLVGDVGYGKTEIAVRAAFKAVQSGRQVAVLVPTTILAEQHGRTFGDRLADFPIAVGTLSRFQTAKEQTAVLAALAEKKLDIVIGTHRLLSADVLFADLGLVIVDEEHRFGVKHKERLKRLKLETDVLTLTATPIPRTLHQSLAGLRDMTVIETPPRDRSPVLTFVEPWDDGLIEEAIARELDRGGQVFFVHNRIETIEAIADHVKRLAPRATVAVAHGQMRERDLDEVMRKFVAGDVTVLVSTLIVESGLDVPNANTMFVNRADHLGLAQLYQLRGRVGRSHRRAYCYLLVPDEVDTDAERRLEVLEHHTELGAGYKIAMRDLEMRGAGNLLGPEQSGFVQAVGFELYLKMLEQTVHRVMRGVDAPVIAPADVTLDVPSYLPDEYLTVPEVKIGFYRRVSAAKEPADIDAMRAELRDRFGPLPAPAETLLAAALLRVLGGRLGLEGILVRGDEARITFRADAAPRLKGLTAAFHEVQFQAEVRRTNPLSLKLTRLGGAALLEGLARALRSLTV